MIKIRYASLPEGLHAWVASRGRHTIVYLRPGLGPGERRIALVRVRRNGRMGYGPRLSGVSLARAVAADRAACTVRNAAAAVHCHPVGTLGMSAMLAGAVACYLALESPARLADFPAGSNMSRAAAAGHGWGVGTDARRTRTQPLGSRSSGWRAPAARPPAPTHSRPEPGSGWPAAGGPGDSLRRQRDQPFPGSLRWPDRARWHGGGRADRFRPDYRYPGHPQPASLAHPQAAYRGYQGAADRNPGAAGPDNRQPNQAHPGNRHHGPAQPGNRQPSHAKSGTPHQGSAQPGSRQPSQVQPRGRPPAQAKPGDHGQAGRRPDGRAPGRRRLPATQLRPQSGPHQGTGTRQHQERALPSLLRSPPADRRPGLSGSHVQTHGSSPGSAAGRTGRARHPLTAVASAAGQATRTGTGGPQLTGPAPA